MDTSENRSGFSNLAWKKPDDNTTPSAPLSVGIYAGISVLDLWWTAPDTNTDGSSLLDLAGYNIYRGISDGIYNPAPINGTSPYTGVSYTDSGVISRQTYYYAIKAVDNDGHESPFSMQVSAKLASETQPPESPISLSITEKESELLLMWNPNHESGLAGYNIYRGTSSGVYARIDFALLINTWYVDVNVSPGQTYYYVVTAVDENGNESGYSNEVSGMIGQGEIWINYPTASNPAGIDFGDPSPSNHAVISYSYDAVLSSVYLEIVHSDTGEIVYDIWDWKQPPPWQPDYLTWDGKYTNSNECVPDGWYDMRLSGIFGALVIETEERWSVYVINCDASKIEVEITANSPITPGAGNEPDTSSVSVKITTFGSTSPDQQIKLRANVELKSGRHFHESATSMRPIPRLLNSGQWVQEYEIPVINGTIVTTFKPSMGANNAKRGIAGKYNITATYNGIEKAKEDIEVKYSLTELASGTNYYLRKADPKHNNGDYHYGTTSANQAIQDAADKFRENYGKNYTPQRKMVVNDQSLKWGGLFDIDGNFNQPHESHRDGRNVDISYKYYDGGEVSVVINSIAWDRLKAALDEKFGATNVVREDDKNHFHCTK